jgi:tetratricopeptide (TPR) repeat protein
MNAALAQRFNKTPVERLVSAAFIATAVLDQRYREYRDTCGAETSAQYLREACLRVTFAKGLEREEFIPLLRILMIAANKDIPGVTELCCPEVLALLAYQLVKQSNSDIFSALASAIERSHHTHRRDFFAAVDALYEAYTATKYLDRSDVTALVAMIDRFRAQPDHIVALSTSFLASGFAQEGAKIFLRIPPSDRTSCLGRIRDRLRTHCQCTPIVIDREYHRFVAALIAAEQEKQPELSKESLPQSKSYRVKLCDSPQLSLTGAVKAIKSLAELGNYELACTIGERYLGVGEREPEFIALLRDCYQSIGNSLRQRELDEALTAARHHEAEHELKFGDFAEAIRLAQSMVLEDPTDRYAISVLAHAYTQEGRILNACELYITHGVVSQVDVNHCKELIIKCFALDCYNIVELLVNKVLAFESNDLFFAESLARLSTRYPHLFDCALQMVTRLEPSLTSDKEWIRAGRIYLMLNIPEKARAALHHVDKTSPLRAKAIFTLAQVERHARNFRAAMGLLLDLPRTGSDQADISIALAQVALDDNQYAIADRYLKEAVKAGGSPATIEILQKRLRALQAA